MKKGFTLIEMIIAIVILGILSVGTFVSIQQIYLRVAKSKALSELSLDSQIVVDQISSLLYDRVPSSIRGYSSDNINTFHNIDDDFNLTILEWYGSAVESMNHGAYSGFVDMDKSDKDSNTIASDDINETDINNTFHSKFASNVDVNLSLIFAGAFDEAGNLKDYNISNINDENISLTTQPNEIYEKFYIADSAYAITRVKELNISTCNAINGKNYEDNALILFYNYRPWLGGSNNGFCDGNVTILSEESKAFEIGYINDSLYFNLTLERDIRGIEHNITISKQKVVF